ncbi:MAG TPA: phage holin family protein [Clostridiaceae bacterium]|nr:phage holin family protein [Clostridiaceae bacterium]
MENQQYENTQQVGGFSIAHFIIRFIVGAVILGITAALTPGFTIEGIWPLLLGALVLAILDYVVLRILGVNATPFGRGLTGFILAAVIIYVTQFFVEGYNVTIWGALIGALIYGLVDLIIPGRAM